MAQCDGVCVCERERKRESESALLTCQGLGWERELEKTWRDHCELQTKNALGGIF